MVSLFYHLLFSILDNILIFEDALTERCFFILAEILYYSMPVATEDIGDS